MGDIRVHVTGEVLKKRIERDRTVQVERAWEKYQQGRQIAQLARECDLEPNDLWRRMVRVARDEQWTSISRTSGRIPR